MPDFVQLWVYLSSAPLFGLTATLVVYLLAQRFYAAMDQAPWANPVLWSVLALGAGLLATGVPYPSYFAGAQFIHFLLGPAVVALGFPLWERRAQLRRDWGRFVAAALAGGAAAAISAVALGWAFGLPDDVLRSLAPKSVTAPVAMGVADKIGGVPALAAVFAVLTGLIGAVALMRPSKSVQDLELKSVKKKFKSANFAAGCSREVITRGAEMLGWTLDDLITRTIAAMRATPAAD